MKNREAFFKRVIFFTTAAVLFVGGPLLVGPINKLKGKGLNSRAWRASYSERHLPVPPGPREGWWGVHLAAVHDDRFGWVLPERHVPGYFDIDHLGMQTVVGAPNPKVHLLIVGGSVAAGAYASNLGRTYFSQLAHRLSVRACPVKVTVLAAGAWTSDNELKAFRFYVDSIKPDYAIFLDGLNDLILPKELPEEKRVVQYLANMRQARDIGLAHHIKVVFALQPFLPEKIRKTALEELIVQESTARGEHLGKTYGELKEGLRSLLIPGEVYMADCSGAFDRRKKTVFADIWHFSDVGHAILAKRLTRDLTPIIAPEKSRAGNPTHLS